MEEKLHHVVGCKNDDSLCWKDADGYEWHPGWSAGVYCRTPEGKVFISSGYDFEKHATISVFN